MVGIWESNRLVVQHGEYGWVYILRREYKGLRMTGYSVLTQDGMDSSITIANDMLYGRRGVEGQAIVMALRTAKVTEVVDSEHWGIDEASRV